MRRTPLPAGTAVVMLLCGATAPLLLPLNAAAAATPAMSEEVTPARAVPVGGPRLTGTTVVAAPEAGVPAPPNVAAGTYVVADADTGTVLAAKGPHVKLRPASTLKTLTALTVAPRLDADRVYVANA